MSLVLWNSTHLRANTHVPSDVFNTCSASYWISIHQCCTQCPHQWRCSSRTFGKDWPCIWQRLTTCMSFIAPNPSSCMIWETYLQFERISKDNINSWSVFRLPFLIKTKDIGVGHEDIHTITRSCWDDASETVDCCRFSCTIGSQQAEELVLLYVEPWALR